MSLYFEIVCFFSSIYFPNLINTLHFFLVGFCLLIFWSTWVFVFQFLIHLKDG